jgi:hypothetical protein
MTVHRNQEPEYHKGSRPEVSQEQIDARMAEILEAARQHVGQPVMLYEERVLYEERENWYLRAGIVARSVRLIDQNEGPPTRFRLTYAKTVAYDGYDIEESDLPLRFGLNDAFQTFQTFRPYIGAERERPYVSVVFGKEAIARWFSQNAHFNRVETSTYVQMMRRLGVEPVTAPEISSEVAEERARTTVELVRLALEQTGLTARIDAVYESIGAGMVSLYGGLAIGTAPESVGEANLRTSGKRRERDRNAHRIEALKQKLIDLGATEEDYYRSVAWILGLNLPERSE